MRDLLLICLFLLVSTPAFTQSTEGLGKGEELPTLYEMTAHSQLVIAGKVISGEVKLAQVQVDEVFRGQAKLGQNLQIAFRDFNMDLGKEDRILFANGETDILFLVPEVTWQGKPKGKDRYTLYRGHFGKFTLPREGDEIYREALRMFAGLAAEKDHRKLYREIGSLLGNPNPILAETGLKEVLRLDLMDADLLPRVLPYFRDPSPQRRSQSLKLLGRFFLDLKPGDRSPELQDEALGPILALARNDPDERVRICAVEALGAWGGEEVLSTLEAVAEPDSAQSVRYEAKVTLLRRSKDEKNEKR